MSTTPENAVPTTEPILTEERLGRWFDMFDEMLGIKQPEDQK